MRQSVTPKQPEPKKKLANVKVKKTFIYSAINDKKETESGEVQAFDQKFALLLLKKRNLTKIKLKEKKEGHSFFSKYRRSNRITSQDIAVFTRQLATMQSAGLPIVQGLKIIKEGTVNLALNLLLTDIVDGVEQGKSLSTALKQHSDIFDELYCNLIAAGEEAGTLDTMLNRIALYKEKTESIKRKIKKAMYYPIGVLSVAAIVTIVLLVKVVPTFKTMFESFGAELPAFTLFVLKISELLQKYFVFLIGGVIFAFWYIKKLHQTSEKFRHLIQRNVLKLPILGNVLHKSIVARFARTLSTTFSAGVPLTTALISVAKSTGNVVYHDKIMHVKGRVSEGMQLHKALYEQKIFPVLIIQMVSIGEEAGNLDDMLSKSANIYEEEVDTMVDGISSLLEPMIMVVLGIVVGGLIISMYLPIFQLGSVI